VTGTGTDPELRPHMRGTVAHNAHRSAIHWLGIEPGSGAILSAGADGKVMAWDPAEPEQVRVIASVPSPIYCAWQDDHGQRMVVGTSAGELFVLNMDERREAQRIQAHGLGIFSLATDRAGLLYSAGGDGTLGLWQWSNGSVDRLELIRRIPLGEAKLRAIAIHGDQLAVACGDGPVHVLEAGSMNEIATITAHGPGASALVWHPGKPVLLSGGKDGEVAVWDVRNDFKSLLRIATHRSTIYHMAFSPDGALLATASRDKTVKLWSAKDLDPVQRLDIKAGGHSHSVNALAWNGKDLYTAGDDRRVIRWTVR